MMRMSLANCFGYLVFLLAVAIVLGSQPAGANPSDTIYLTAEQPIYEQYDEEKDYWTNRALSYREVVRQAFLLSAYEQFGVKIRDATLREPIPSNSQSPGLMRLSIKNFAHDSPFRVEYQLQQGKKKLMKGELEYRYAFWYSYHWMLLRNSYPWAMEEVAEVLEKEGYERITHPEPDYDDTTLPKEMEEKLLAMDVLSQYMAVRMAHAAIAEKGETLGLLTVLTRGYGNLGQLTEYYPSQMRLAFAARSLYYSKRMVEVCPESPLGFWNQGYAYMVMGQHASAKEAFKNANRTFKKSHNKKEKPTTPDWYPLLQLAYEFDTEALEKEAHQEGPYQELAGLLWYRSVEFGGSQYLNMTVGKECLSLLPRCTRITNGMNRKAGVAYGHHTTTMGFKQFAALLQSELPKMMAEDDDIRMALEEIKEPLHTFQGMYALREALLKAAENDSSPMSLAVLARLIDEEVMTMIIYRVTFLRDYLGSDATGFMDATRPFYKGHPVELLIETCRYPKGARLKIAKIVRDFKPTEGNLFTVRSRLFNRVPKDLLLAKKTAGEYKRMLFANSSSRETDYAFKSYAYEGNLQERIKYISLLGQGVPNSPHRTKLRILYDWEKLQKKSKPKWLAKQEKHPVVAGALAQRYAERGEYEKAEELYLVAIEGMPEYEPYKQLAALYWNHLDDEERMFETVEEYLEQEDFGLGHSELCREVVYSLMSQGRAEEALPWAERAAQSYSGQGLEALANCKERLGDFETARKILEAEDQRYDTSKTYNFIARTGVGDLEEAYRTKRKNERNHPSTTPMRRLSNKVDHSTYTEEPEKALAACLQLPQMSPDSALYFLGRAAAEADTLGKTEVRDQCWRKIANASAEMAPESSRNESLKKFAQLCLDATEDSPPSFEQIQTLGMGPKYTTYANVHYLAGRFFEARGDDERAVQHYSEAAKSSFWGWSPVIDSWRRLRNLGEEPTELQPYWYGLAKFAYNPPAVEAEEKEEG